METITNWKELATGSLDEMGRNFMEVLPNIVGAILVLVLGWLGIKFIILLLRRVFKFIKIEKWTQILNDKVLPKQNLIKFDVGKAILIFIKWILYLVVFIIAADVMNWEMVSEEIRNLLRYLPKLFSALALLMLGLYVANFIRNAIQGIFESFDLRGAKITGSIIFYIIAFIVTITALNQAGIETEIITNNATLIMGAFLAAIAISLGLGARGIVKDILRTSYARKKFKVGQRVTYKEITGTISALEHLTMDIETDQGVLIIPIQKVSEEEIMRAKETKAG